MTFGASSFASVALAGLIAFETVALPILPQAGGFSSMFGGGYFGAVEMAGVQVVPEPQPAPALTSSQGFSCMFGGGYFGAVEMAGAQVVPEPPPAPALTSAQGFSSMFGGGYFGAVEMAGVQLSTTPAPAVESGGVWRAFRRYASVKLERLLVVSELSPISARTAARAEIKPASARAQAGDVLVLAVCRVPAGHPVVHRTKLEKPMITAVQNPGDEDLLVIAAHLWD